MNRQELRRLTADRIAAVLAASGWTQSLFHPDNIGKDSRSRVHLSYAIAVGETQGHDRGRPFDGTHANTMVRVRWVHHLRAGGQDGQVEDYDAALVAEQRLLVACLDETVIPELSIWFDTIADPKPIGDGTYVSGELRFMAGHLLPLA